MFNIIPYGEKALLVNFKTEISLEIHQQVKSVYSKIKELNLKGITGFIPAYQSLTICFDDNTTTYKKLETTINNLVFDVKEENTLKNIITIPVCYELGVDLDIVSKNTKLSISEIIKLHTAKPYLVYMMGFTPGFMYLGGLNKKLQVPRKETPRLKVEAGSVGLADQQTGIYPLDTPGGWQIIGKTPLKLFDKNKGTLVKMGNYIKFNSISIDEFNNLKEYD